jgi:hypothetical protein
VAGGLLNKAGGFYSTIAGGYGNSVSADNCAIGGGQYNKASGVNAVVAGGYYNTASGDSSFVGGGGHNTASSLGAVVGGGRIDQASGLWATVGGGQADTVVAWWGGVSSGWRNVAGDESADTAAYVGGGKGNRATSKYATVLGGSYNTASGQGSVVPGGTYVTVSGVGSFGFGWGVPADTVKVTDDYDVVFGDGGTYNYEFGINNENPSYPLHVGTNTSNGNGAYLSAGGTWTNGSSREFKEDFRELDGNEILDKVGSLSVKKWRYKGTNEEHIGPVAEDFRQAFGTGDNEKYLASSDMSGVTMRAVQELIKTVRTQQEEIDALKAEIENMKSSE